MKLTMLSTQSGSRQGGDTERFIKGGTYEFNALNARELDLARVFLREKWAEEAKADAPVGEPLPPINPVRKEGLPEVYRLPLLKEYLESGAYKEENYERFILNETKDAHARGQRVEVRDRTPEEIKAAEHALAEQVQKEEDERKAAERKRQLNAAAQPKPASTSRPSGGTKQNK